MKRKRETDVAAAIDSVLDALRGGLSLRQAVIHAAGTEGSPLALIAATAAGGRPLVQVLRDAAASASDPALRSALCVLSAHADAGGDPVPACGALAARLRRRQAAQREARALTTQARLGARAMLLLTPGFWVLLVAADPRGTSASLHDARVRAATIVGLGLQVVGALWISGIVRRGAGSAPRWAKIAVLRAVFALAAGRERSPIPMEVAETADTLAFVLDAGYAPSAAVGAVAPIAPGLFGVRLREAMTRIEVGARLTEALGDATSEMEESAQRFASAFETSMSLGVPLAPRLRTLADGLSERSSQEQNEDIRRASVRVLLPLGLLILPAFVLSCLVPLLVGGLSGIAGS